MRKKLFAFCVISCALVGISVAIPLSQWIHTQKILNSYPLLRDHPHLTAAQRTLMAPYLLPHEHPLKPTLDHLFSQARITQDKETLLHAGFDLIATMPGSFVIVARHPALPGYVFKLYLDDETRCKEAIPNCEWLTRRCIGAKYIRALIHKHHLKHFTIPDKWLYLLPIEPRSQGPIPQPIVLIETDMQLVTEEQSKEAWKKEITPSHLQELHNILKLGYGSIRVAENIPFTEKGTFAFTDTEYPKRKLKLRKVKPYLSDDMQSEWDKLKPLGY